MAKYSLPDLPYAFDALEPHIDARTMEIHHDKHHAGYVKQPQRGAGEASGVQRAGRHRPASARQIDTVPEDIRTAVRNNGGGHANHSLFWKIMSPKGGGEPSGALGEAVRSAFGDFAKLRDEFGNAAKTRFGSGWAWLGIDGGGKLHVHSTANQDSPLMEGHRPILGLDVWEHAYYLKYQNRRPDYIEAWWNVVNWQEVGKRFEQAKG